MTQRVVQWINHRLALGHTVAVASVISTSGSVPGKAGARLAMTSGEDRFGTVGGAGLEYQVISMLDEMLENGEGPGGEVVTYALYKDAKGYEVVPLDSLCGGRVTLSLEVIFPMPHLLLMGGGHVAAAIADFCGGMGWDYSIQDTRVDYADNEAYPDARELHAGSVTDFFEGEDKESLSRYSHIYLLGHDWKEDQERFITLLNLLQGAGPKIGVIGSQSKWQAFTDLGLKAGATQATLDKVKCPIGLSIGAETPSEIAIAIIAEIIEQQRSSQKN